MKAVRLIPPMLHPFFDVGAFPLGRPEGQALYTRLYSSINTAPQIKLLYGMSGDDLLPLNLIVPIPQIWMEALENLTRARRLRQFCTVIRADTNFAALHQYVQAIEDAKDLIAEPTLSDELIFIDRLPLRNELRRVATGDRIGVLLVRGASGAGKSWTRTLVQDVAKSVGARCISVFEGSVATVEETIEALFTGLGQNDLVPEQLESEDAWFRRACSKLHAAAQKSGKVTWIVADDLGEYDTGPRLDRMIRRFFDQFALNMGNAAFREWFRLVLLDYPEVPLPTKWQKDVWVEDRPSETDVKEDAVAEFILLWARRRDRKIDYANALKLAGDVLTVADNPATPALAARRRLERIHDSLAATLAKL